MKTCPLCHLANSDVEPECSICGSDLTGVPPDAQSLPDRYETDWKTERGYGGEEIEQAFVNARRCARWTLRFSIFWALITFSVIGFMGFFWAYGMGGSDPDQGAFNFMLGLLLVPWLPPQIVLWLLGSSPSALAFHPRMTAPLILFGYLLLVLAWCPLSFFGLTWESIKNIVLFCYLPYFVLVVGWLPWLYFPATSTAQRSEAPSVFRSSAASHKRRMRPLQPRRRLSKQRTGEPLKDIEAGPRVDAPPTAVVQAPPLAVGQEVSEVVPIQASQTVAGREYLTANSTLLFDHNDQLDSYSARSLIPGGARLEVVSPGTWYVLVRTESGSEGFVAGTAELLPVDGPGVEGASS